MAGLNSFDRKGAKFQYDISWFYHFFFKIKLNSRTWMILKSSVLIFQTLKHQHPQWPLQPQQPLWPLQPYFIKKILVLIIASSLAPKWPILVHFCRIYHQTSNFSLILAPVGCCWGQLMLTFWKLVDETQMPKPLKAPRHHNSKKMLILLPVRAI